jgi:hypothetical protein
MTNNDRKIIEKIHRKIDTLAKRGKDHVFEYYKYIDELVDKGQYGYVEQVMSIYYDIDITNMIDVNEVKRKTWKPILFRTNSTFSTKLKKMYDSKNVYQIGLNIYETHAGTFSSTLIGQIYEYDVLPNDPKYLSQNSELVKLLGHKVTYLNAVKNHPGAEYYPITGSNNTLSEDKNLLLRYAAAVDYLLEDEWVLRSSYWDDLGYWDDFSWWND